MAKNKGGLGRGLDSLFADTLPENESESGGEVTTLPLRDIEPDKDQPRKAFEEESLTELAASITEHRQLMDKCGLTQEQAAEKLGKKRSSLANSLRLLNLPAPVLEQLRLGALSMGHAKPLLALGDPALQEQAASQIVAQDLNVRQAEALCKRMAKPAPEEKPQAKAPTLPKEVELSLHEIIGNEVKVKYKEGKGTLTVHFYSDKQLTDFANLLGHYDRFADLPDPEDDED